MIPPNPYLSEGQGGYAIDRPEIQDLIAILRGQNEQQGLVLLGGHGSGKTTALNQIAQALTGESGLFICLPRDTPTESGCHIEISRTLGININSAQPNCRDAIEQWLTLHPTERLLLLFDEFGSQLPDAGRAFFNLLEGVRQQHVKRLSILLAGGVRLLRFEMGNGSPFMLRARRILLRPLGDDAIARLAAPFREQLSIELSSEVLATIRVLTGGNAYLVTHVLQRLWTMEERAIEQVVNILDDEERLSTFKEGFESALEVRHPKHPMQQVWEHLVTHDDPYDLPALEQVCQDSEPADVRPRNILRFLEAAGLLRYTIRSQHVHCAIFQSLLQPPRPVLPPLGSLQQRLDRDLQRILSEIHCNGADYYKSGRGGTAKEIVPEAVFSAAISMSLRFLGWYTSRETQQADGRVDVRAEHSDFPKECAVVEVKIWPRNDYESIGVQAAGYHQPNVTAFAAVMLADIAKVEDWRERYQEKCLAEVKFQNLPEVHTSIVAGYCAKTPTPDGIQVEVTHLLLRVPSGAG